MMRPISNREEYVGLRNNPANVENTKLARMGNPEAKRKMLQFCYSCMPAEGGKLKGSKTPSNSVGMDIDFAKDMPKEELESAMKIMIGRVLKMKEDLNLLMLERSATKGLHIVFKRICFIYFGSRIVLFISGGKNTQSFIAHSCVFCGDFLFNLIG